MTTASELNLKELVDDLFSTYREIAKHIGIEVDLRLLPGTTESAIARFERDRNVHFPPSYREFLKLYNGWIGFLGSFSLIGVLSQDFEEALNAIDLVKAEFARCWAANRHSTDPTYIRDYEAGGANTGATLAEAHIYLPTKAIFGVGYAGHFLFFDERTRTSAGEMEVVHLSPDWELQARYDNFEQMLRDYYVGQHLQLEIHVNHELQQQAKKPRRKR
jgi:hypothetical protein